MDYRSLPDGTPSREALERIVADFPASTEPIDAVVTFDRPVAASCRDRGPARGTSQRLVRCPT